jgi:hypothetical protein
MERTQDVARRDETKRNETMRRGERSDRFDAALSSAREGDTGRGEGANGERRAGLVCSRLVSAPGAVDEVHPGMVGVLGSSRRKRGVRSRWRAGVLQGVQMVLGSCQQFPETREPPAASARQVRL